MINQPVIQLAKQLRSMKSVDRGLQDIMFEVLRELAIMQERLDAMENRPGASVSKAA
jgi:hypothetical protein